MSTLDLRPLSVGELLDRTFSLYRRHFLLFIGISAIPELLVLALQLVQLAVVPSRLPGRAAELQASSGGGGFAVFGIAIDQPEFLYHGE
ncbi:MAG: hypothetical protein WBE13_15335 [Candidatus Acidiferrum sp.]